MLKYMIKKHLRDIFATFIITGCIVIDLLQDNIAAVVAWIIALAYQALHLIDSYLSEELRSQHEELTKELLQYKEISRRLMDENDHLRTLMKGVNK